jgi:hypothetical protein
MTKEGLKKIVSYTIIIIVVFILIFAFLFQTGKIQSITKGIIASQLEKITRTDTAPPGAMLDSQRMSRDMRLVTQNITSAIDKYSKECRIPLALDLKVYENQKKGSFKLISNNTYINIELVTENSINIDTKIEDTTLLSDRLVGAPKKVKEIIIYEKGKLKLGDSQVLVLKQETKTELDSVDVDRDQYNVEIFRKTTKSNTIKISSNNADRNLPVCEVTT